MSTLQFELQLCLLLCVDLILIRCDCFSLFDILYGRSVKRQLEPEWHRVGFKTKQVRPSVPLYPTI